jgi:oxalate decarboxylase/phosphoglucose isomerase-like protein (cupin superfamily)
MAKYRVSVDEVESAMAAKSEAGFTDIDLRMLLTDKTVGTKKLSLFRAIFSANCSAHKKHVHVGIEEILFGIRGRGMVGFETEEGKIEEFEISPRVAVLVPKNAVHWLRNLEELEVLVFYSVPDAGDFKPEDYKYMGEIPQQT